MKIYEMPFDVKPLDITKRVVNRLFELIKNDPVFRGKNLKIVNETTFIFDSESEDEAKNIQGFLGIAFLKVGQKLNHQLAI